MKKLSATLLTLLSCSLAQALPVGNPAEATLYLNGAWWDGYCCDPCDPCFSWFNSWSLRIGYYGDFVYNRHLKVRDGINVNLPIDRTEMYTNAGYLALNVCNRIDVFGTLGATTMHLRTDLATISTSDLSILTDLDFKSKFSWSVGARATLWDCDCFFVGAEGQYFQTRQHFTDFINYGNGVIDRFDGVSHRYAEWQVGLGAAYRFAINCPSIAMVPYAAVKWSGARFDLNDYTFLDPLTDEFVILSDLKSSRTWGYAIGMTLTLCDMVGVNVEARFADEKAVSVLGQFRF